MKAIGIAALVLTFGAHADAADSRPSAEFAPNCLVVWDWSEPYAHSVLCTTDSGSSFPPGTLPLPQPDVEKKADVRDAVLPGDDQQKSRRLPGGFSEIDVKKRD